MHPVHYRNAVTWMEISSPAMASNYDRRIRVPSYGAKQIEMQRCKTHKIRAQLEAKGA